MPNGGSPHEVGEVRIVPAEVGDAVVDLLTEYGQREREMLAIRGRPGAALELIAERLRSYGWIENDPDRLRRLYITKEQRTVKLNRFRAMPKVVTPIDSAGRFSCGGLAPGSYDLIALTYTPERTTGERRRYGAYTLITDFAVTKIRVPRVGPHAPVVVIVPRVFRNMVHLDPEHPPSGGVTSPST